MQVRELLRLQISKPTHSHTTPPHHPKPIVRGTRVRHTHHRTHTHIITHRRACTHMHAHTTHRRVCTHMHTHTHRHVRMHAHTRTHTHHHTQTRVIRDGYGTQITGHKSRDTNHALGRLDTCGIKIVFMPVMCACVCAHRGRSGPPQRSSRGIHAKSGQKWKSEHLIQLPPSSMPPAKG